MSKKILVTGASGLLGTEICTQLKNAGHYVIAVDNHSRSSTIPPCDEFMTLDLMSPFAYDEMPKNVDEIYHYAAINGTKNFYERPNEVLTNNFISDVNMFKFAEKWGVSKFVYASTSEIVSDDPLCPVPELTDISIKDIHNARWSYRIAKVASENYLANNKKLPWVIFRYFNVYGDNSKAGHFIADQIDKIDRGVFKVMGGDESRSFCHVEDAIRATIHCANATNGEVINIGNDQETFIQDAAKIVAYELGHEGITWEQLPGMPGSTKRRVPDISRLRELMSDYSPRTFSEGVRRIIQFRMNKS